MRSFPRGMTVAWCALVLTAMGCDSGHPAEPGGPSARLSLEFLNAVDSGSSEILPTYISHLVTSSRFPLSRVTLTNTGARTASFVVTMELPNYGDPASETVTLTPGESQSFGMSPAVDFATLFQLTAAVPAVLEVTVSSSGVPLVAHSYPMQLSGRDTVFWRIGGNDASRLIATMVTPTDKAMAIADLTHEAGLLFPGGALLGYQAGGVFPSQDIGPTQAGYYRQETARVMDGERLVVRIDKVVNGQGTADAASVYILDDANFENWKAQTSSTMCAGSASAKAGSEFTCSDMPAGLYHIVYYNPSSSTSTRTVTRRRTMVETESTYEQTLAIFMALRNRGLIYANLPGGTGYFGGTQNVMYPSESLATLNANCIEGALVFASAWERMGMEPLLVLNFAHGHAFAAVRCWTGANCVIPIETTAVGGSLTFDEAYSTAADEWDAWGPSGDDTSMLIDIKEARADGLLPAPM